MVSFEGFILKVFETTKFTWSELSAGSGCSSVGLGVHDDGKEVVEGVDDTETSTSSAINPRKLFKIVPNNPCVSF